MIKEELLAYLADSGGANAIEVAGSLDSTYFAASMALLRLCRQSLVSRHIDPDTGNYWYDLTDRGAERLAYLESESP
jgi:DNA-binding MarR family transcriptional regulator